MTVKMKDAVKVSDRIVIFHRAEGFYPAVFTPQCKPEDHAKLNPGTLRIEELSGEILWPIPPKVRL